MKELERCGDDTTLRPGSCNLRISKFYSKMVFFLYIKRTWFAEIIATCQFACQCRSCRYCIKGIVDYQQQRHFSNNINHNNYYNDCEWSKRKDIVSFTIDVSAVELARARSALTYCNTLSRSQSRFLEGFFKKKRIDL